MDCAHAYSLVPHIDVRRSRYVCRRRGGGIARSQPDLGGDVAAGGRTAARLHGSLMRGMVMQNPTLVACAAAFAAFGNVRGLDNGLGATPALGWSSCVCALWLLLLLLLLLHYLLAPLALLRCLLRPRAPSARSLLVFLLLTLHMAVSLGLRCRELFHIRCQRICRATDCAGSRVHRPSRRRFHLREHRCWISAAQARPRRQNRARPRQVPSGDALPGRPPALHGPTPRCVDQLCSPGDACTTHHPPRDAVANVVWWDSPWGLSLNKSLRSQVCTRTFRTALVAQVRAPRTTTRKMPRPSHTIGRSSELLNL
eukprot:COSAG01_NODE_10103_length_2250_cov_109.099954_3_plen_312_part_00